MIVTGRRSRGLQKCKGPGHAAGALLGTRVECYRAANAATKRSGRGVPKPVVTSYASRPNTAPALANFLYLPMLFLSGLLKQLPDTIQHIGSVLPPYYYAELAWKTIGVNDESTLRRAGLAGGLEHRAFRDHVPALPARPGSEVQLGIRRNQGRS